MSTDRVNKIKKLLDLHVQGTVLLASWLNKNGISHDLQQRYRRSGWIESVGVGAFKLPNDNLNWQGALYSLQVQIALPIHAGGPTALSLLGDAHYMRTAIEPVYLFSGLSTKLPSWFVKYHWGVPVRHVKTSFLPSEVGVVINHEGSFPIKISSPERAILECLYLTPGRQGIFETYQILSGLVNLRPDLVQSLLNECKSIRVKRLFLCMLKKAGHQWGRFLDLSSINLGSGVRELVKNGVYDAEYRIVIPRELAQL